MERTPPKKIRSRVDDNRANDSSCVTSSPLPISLTFFSFTIKLHSAYVVCGRRLISVRTLVNSRLRQILRLQPRCLIFLSYSCNKYESYVFRPTKKKKENQTQLWVRTCVAQVLLHVIEMSATSLVYLPFINSFPPVSFFFVHSSGVFFFSSPVHSLCFRNQLLGNSR